MFHIPQLTEARYSIPRYTADLKRRHRVYSLYSIHRFIRVGFVLFGATPLFGQTAELVLSGSNLRMVSSGNVYVVLNEANWTNNASAVSFVPGSGTVLFTGNVNHASLGGSASSAFYTLQSNKPGKELRLQADISVSNRAQLLAGDVNLQNRTLDLAGTGSLAGEVYPNGQRFYCLDNNSGRIRAVRTLSTGANADIAGLALDLNVTGTAPGSTLFFRGHDAQTSTASGGSTSIGRYYDITPTIGTGFTYTFVFRYHELELGMVPESNFILYRSPSYAANTADWQAWGAPPGIQSPGYPTVGTAVHNTASNTVTLTGINSFSRWTVSNPLVNPLPIELLTFGADCEGTSVRMHWTTASESNNERFVPERSADLQHWQELPGVPGAGNSNVLRNYQTEDKRPLPGFSYYRLRQVDYDGQSETFSPVGVFCGNTAGCDALGLYPNPADGKYTVSVNAHADDPAAELLWIDMNGRLLRSSPVKLVQGHNEFSFDREGLASGSYTVRLRSKSVPVAPVKLVLY